MMNFTPGLLSDNVRSMYLTVHIVYFPLFESFGSCSAYASTPYSINVNWIFYAFLHRRVFGCCEFVKII